MDQPVRKHLVVSAVNIRKGGTLTVLRDCLQYLSTRKDLEVTALVHQRSLCDFDGIRYIEIPWSIRSWGRRLWCEYVTMNRISRQLPEADLWLSLHDTTPRVHAKRQAVYCHTSFPFLKVQARDFRMDVKIPLFALFTRYAYQLNVRRNAYLIVQQEWFRKGLADLLHFPESRIVVAPPHFNPVDITGQPSGIPVFLYPATPDCHKGFETVCEAARLLEDQLGADRFCLVLTIDGTENHYARWIKGKWGDVRSIDFHGFMSREELAEYYGRADCLVFPSRVETWGLPISEFKQTGRPMILSDLPYAHESASGAPLVAFVTGVQPFYEQMLKVIQGIFTNFAPAKLQTPAPPMAPSWDRLFEILSEEDADPATR